MFPSKIKIFCYGGPAHGKRLEVDPRVKWARFPICSPYVNALVRFLREDESVDPRSITFESAVYLRLTRPRVGPIFSYRGITWTHEYSFDVMGLRTFFSQFRILENWPTHDRWFGDVDMDEESVWPLGWMFIVDLDLPFQPRTFQTIDPDGYPPFKPWSIR